MPAEADETSQLKTLVAHSALLPEASLRRHWLRVIDWLPPPARHELLEILVAAENACRT